MPMNFGEAPDYYRRFLAALDVICLQARRRWTSTATSTSAPPPPTSRRPPSAPASVIVETCEAMPYIYGREERDPHPRGRPTSSTAAAAAMVELGNPPIERGSTSKVATLIAAEIEDGACLQIGIGGMPNAVCEMLVPPPGSATSASTPRCSSTAWWIWSRPASSPARRKAIDQHQIVFTFALGSRRQYDFLHHNTGRAQLRRRLHQPARQDHAAIRRWCRSTTRPRSTCRDRSASERDGPSPPHRHRRPTAVRPRRLRLSGRQIVHLPGVHLREARPARGAAS